MSRRTRRELLAAAAGALASGGAPSAHAAVDAALPVSPEGALDAWLRTPAPANGEGPWRVSDESPEAAEARRREPAERLDRLRALPAGPVSPRARLDRDTAVAHLTLQARLGREFPFGAAAGRPYVIEPRAGTHRLVAAGLGGPAPDAASADAYLAAVRRLARNVDGETERLRADADGFGVILPAPLMARTLAAVRSAGAVGSADSPIARRAPDPPAIGALVDAELRPALARQAEALETLARRSRPAGGAGAFRDGGRYLALCLRLGTGTDLTPEAAEAQARDAALVLTAELDRRLRVRGLTQGGVGERLRALAADPAGLYADDDAGRDRAVADLNAVLVRARDAAGRLVADLPSGPIAVRRMGRADEAAGRAGYREVTAAGGTYYVDLHAIRSRPAWTLPTVVAHETVPGHLVQLPLERAAAPPPLRLRGAPGYFEGWAVYAETLGAELGLYDGLAWIGHAQSLLMRLGRVLADAGVHRHGWPAERVRAELAALYGFPLFNAFDAEAERIVLAPGAGGTDALAWLEIARLRRAAPDPRAFHHAVLAHGPYPPRLLERAVALG